MHIIEREKQKPFVQMFSALKKSNLCKLVFGSTVRKEEGRPTVKPNYLRRPLVDAHGAADRPRPLFFWLHLAGLTKRFPT